MRTVFLVPRREDKGHRDKLWEYCRARWQTYCPDIPIFEGHHEHGPFNRSAAVNRAAEAAGDWDIGVILDADVVLKRSQVHDAIQKAGKTGKVTWGHRRWRGINEDWTTRIVADQRDLGAELELVDDMDVLVERTTPLSWSCCIAVPRKVWDDLGGMDERFVGWGFEDLALQSAVVGLYGYERIEGDVIHLFHERSDERIVKGEPAITARPEYIANGRLGRRYMYALRRDYGRTDRPGVPDPEDLKRDLGNLQRDDAKFGRLQPSSERRKWDGWWPTLEELIEGAKDFRQPKVTVIVHTGGESENWEQRSAYLRRSLASLNEQVQGPIIQRVIYSDWGPNPELKHIADEFGFYVAGPSEHVGYTSSMQQMWAYLAKRARGAFIFQAEDDFIYSERVELQPMIRTLEAQPELAQIVLLRQACYPREMDPATILGWPKEQFTSEGMNGTSLLSHRLFWSQNPALYSKRITVQPWPSGSSSERLFGDQLMANGMRFGLWGTGEPSIEHIGEVRAGVDY